MCALVSPKILQAMAVKGLRDDSQLKKVFYCEHKLNVNTRVDSLQPMSVYTSTVLFGVLLVFYYIIIN